MKYTDNSLNILTIKSYKGIGNAWIVKNILVNESIEKIVSLINSKIKEPTTISEFENLKSQFEQKLLNKFENICDGLVAIGDQNFPHVRGNVKDSEKPVFLYYKGNIELLSAENKNIAVIGLLNPENDIETRERRVVAEFVKKGATIVSGLAFGCDSIAHQQTLDSNGTTVAILPSPLTNILPARNKVLAFKIVDEGGLLITEYGTDFKSKMELSTRYRQRDRLQALFSDTIILAASYSQNSSERWQLFGQKLDSGARLAMGYANDYNIPCAVMYDPELDQNNPMFDLNRDLIKEERNITIISQVNYSEMVLKIMGSRLTNRNSEAIQGNLFD
jgi:DNA processing protein